MCRYEGCLASDVAAGRGDHWFLTVMNTLIDVVVGDLAKQT